MNTNLTPLERRVGDLDHPWYTDERTRFMSYEIYTVTAQALLFSTTLVALGMAWSGNKTTAAWGCGVMAAAYIPHLYAGSRIQRSMEPAQRRFHLNSRAAILVLLYMSTVVGLSVTFSGTKHPLTTTLGSSAFWGSIVGVITAMISGWWKTKKADKNRPDPADIPDED